MSSAFDFSSAALWANTTPLNACKALSIVLALHMLQVGLWAFYDPAGCTKAFGLRYDGKPFHTTSSTNLKNKAGKASGTEEVNEGNHWTSLFACREVAFGLLLLVFAAMGEWKSRLVSLARCLRIGLNANRSTASPGVGDYVAQGMSMSSHSNTQSIPGTQVVSEGVLTVSGHVLTATKLENGDILVANTTVHPDLPTVTAVSNNDTSTPSNGTGGDCYASWDSYWSASDAAYSVSVSQNNLEVVGTSTLLVTQTNIRSAQAATTSPLEITIQTTRAIENGGFTISTQTIDTTSTTLIVQSSQPGTTQVSVNTDTQYNTSTIQGLVKMPPKPTCSLPPVVPACQTSWEAFITSRLVPSPTPPPHCDINAGYLANTNSVPPCAVSWSSVQESYYSKYESSGSIATPLCTAASIGGPLCQSVRDQYQLDDSFRPRVSDAGAAFFFKQGTMGFYNGNTTSWVWPTSSTMGQAPSCTLGCGRCAVTGGTVQLIYWPATSTQSNNVSVKASPTAPPVVTVETLGTTFTSPTLYISYKSLYAANACGTIGTEIGETILAIPPDKPLSSVYAGTVPCDAHFRPTQVWTGTAPFTVEDLQHEPVPYSIYSSQPWCATYAREHGCTETCPTTALYKPILVVNNDLLRGLQGDWKDCWGDIRGVYDPPLALTEAKTEDGPVNTFGAAAQPATGPAPNNAAPTPTAAPDNAPPKTNAKPAPSVSRQPDTPSPPQKTEAPAPKPQPEQSQGPSPNASPDAPQPKQSPAQSPNASPDAPQPKQSQGQSPNASPAAPSQNASPNGPAPSDHQQNPQQNPSPNAPSPTDNPQDQPQNQPQEPNSLGASPSDHPQNPSPNAPSPSNDPQNHPQDQPQNPSPAASPPSDSQPTVIQAAPQAFSLSPVAASQSAIQVVNGDHSAILTAGRPAATVGSQLMSAGSSGNIVVGTGQGASTINAAQAPSGMFISPVADQQSAIQVVSGDHTATLTPGASAVTVGDQVMSAGSSGAVVVGTGKDASTINAVNQPTQATLNAQANTMSEVSGSAVQVVNDGKTETLTPGGSAVTVGSQILSAASSGRVVVGTGSTASTVDVGKTSSKSSDHSNSRTTTTTSGRPSGTTAAAASSSSGASSPMVVSSGLGVTALFFGIFVL
ncbi:hypothetical protein PRZ48_013135 [Zasmidium cellare]|uniref:Uncharacterized protein n=1 Tax=Zasmidium cellare TaxID=395010 RepID=A0ABR0E379_ZASCE|nr:hypothetical protein PRZ48_013135 [Zasmidium cellare]